jgi:hypothetical protein
MLPEHVANMTPLACLLTAMRMAWHKGAIGAAVKIAEAAAPYVHPRLANAVINLTSDDATKTDAELVAELEEVRAKAAAATVRH